MYGGVEKYIYPFILKLVSRGRWVVNFSPPTLSPSVPFEKRLAGIKSFWNFRRREKCFACT
jgi:hypothetical protein